MGPWDSDKQLAAYHESLPPEPPAEPQNPILLQHFIAGQRAERPRQCAPRQGDLLDLLGPAPLPPPRPRR